ncbi:hypothetical protein Pst134EA_015088 [Puccinia striiformis f. sp. tritici]|uniref:hypothetical protein n=1 Tax=Puccinia striiformis f. sp. tritici TaxID=168172 RepID=UPI0020078190|nr:hypothetical protein Pst134EA_015088 [Puccinia striiformis f. sp. tritici]KAH9462999.1 hypothetical protein Pst134EA_015088 [Puccinia striiformis f. sp. tritici]
MNEMIVLENGYGEELEHQGRGEQGDVFDSPYYFMIPISEDHSPTNRAEQHASTYSTNEAGAKETALNRLQRTLPAWKRQLAAYSRLLDPPESQEEAETNLEAVLHAAAELQATTQYLAVDITTVQSEPTRSDDHHLKHLKSYRLHKIHSMLTAACDLIRGSYLKGNEIFGYLEIGLLPEESERRGTQQMALKEAALVIGLAIECIKESDWHLALKYWKSDSKYITRLLEKLVHYVRPHNDALAEEDEYSAERFYREPVIHLAQLMMPIMKLARLFLNKVTLLGMNTKRLPLYTEMSSDRIKSIVESHGHVSISISQTISLLQVADVSPGAETYYQLIETAKELHNRSEAPWLHLVPSITDTNEYPTRKDIKSWIISWNTQRKLAINNFICYARSLIRANQL